MTALGAINSATDLATSNAVLPAGVMMQYAGAGAPTGWLVCDGSEQAVATYPQLDAVLGTTYGARTNGAGGVGSSHFRLPDLRGRVPVGVGANGVAHADVDALGESDGVAVGSRKPKHQHGLGTLATGGGAHNHDGVTQRSGGTLGTLNNNDAPARSHGGSTGVPALANTVSSAGSTHVHTLSGVVGDDTSAMVDTVPYLVVNHIIKT